MNSSYYSEPKKRIILYYVNQYRDSFEKKWHKTNTPLHLYNILILVRGVIRGMDTYRKHNIHNRQTS